MKDRITDFLNRHTVGTIIMAVLFSSVCIFAQPAYRLFKEWRSSNLLSQSKELFDDESYQLAFNKAHTAVLLNGGNIEAARHLATLALQLGHPQAHQYWETVVTNDDAQASDWKSAVDASVRIGDYTTTFAYLRKWEHAGIENEDEYLLRSIRAYALSGKYDIAMASSLEAMDRYPDDEKLRVLHLQLLDIVGYSEQRSNFAKTILSNENSKFSELVWIAKSNSVDEEVRRAALLRSLEIEELTVREELAALGVAAQNDWLDLGSRLQSLQGKVDTEDTQQLASFTSTLCQLGEYALVEQLIDLETAKSDRVLFRNYLLSQIALGASDTALELTSESDARVSSMAEEALIRAMAFKESGEERSFSTNIEQAIYTAEVDDLAFLESQLLQLGEEEALLQLYSKISAHPVLGNQARQLGLNLAYRLRDGDQIQEALNSNDNWISDIRDPREKANAVYLSLIFGVDLNATRTMVEELLAAFPTTTHYRALLCLAYLRSGLSDQAMSVFPVESEQLPQLDLRSRLIATALLNSRDPGGNELDLGWVAENSSLLDQERALVQ